jgi:pyruvate,water dikinase
MRPKATPSRDGWIRLRARAGRAAARGPVCVYSNANVNENYPGPVCPFLASVARLGYYHYFRNLGLAFGLPARRVRAMEGALRQLVAVHAGRLYYNLTNVHAVLREAPFGEFLARSFDDFTGTPGTARRAGPPPLLRQVLEAGHVAGRAGWHLLGLSRRLAAFEAAVDRFAAATAPAALAGRSPAALHDALRQFVALRCHGWLGASLADAASMISYGLLKRFLGRQVPGGDQAGLHNTLLKGLRGLVSAEPVARLWDLSRQVIADPALREACAATTGADFVRLLHRDGRFAAFRADFEAFLEDWGFRRSGELMLTLPSFQEDPAALADVLRSYAALDGEAPPELLGRQEAERREVTARVAALLGPGRAWLLRALLGRTHRAIALRERARHKQALLYQRCRRLVLTIGARLVAAGTLTGPDEGFFLTVQELDALLAGRLAPEPARDLVRQRRRELEAVVGCTPPDHFELPAGAALDPAAAAAAPVPPPPAWRRRSAAPGPAAARHVRRPRSSGT